MALAPEFLAAAEYSTLPGADLEGLLQRLETVSGEFWAPSRTGLAGGRLGSPFHPVWLQKPNHQELESTRAAHPLSFTRSPDW